MNAKSKSGKQEEKKNVQVFVRVRPINNAEKAARSYAVVNCNGSREIVVKERPTDKLTKTFTFDKVFGPESKQIELYKSVVHPLIDEVLAGYNCTVFAYGQTGTGKTFTMEGEKSNDSSVSWENDPLSGIIPRSLSHLFDELRTTNVEYTVRVSFLELYNEEIIDLLSPTDDTSKLKLFEDSTKKGSVIVQGLEEVIVKNKQELYKIMEKGSAKRTTAATLMNAQSSRSHTVFSITVHIKENSIEGEELLRTGKLNLVDLAGSENIGRSGAVDKRAREAGNINQSLLTLGRCITSLVEHCPHIPYRESKLTRLLQESLGGRTKTSIIATVSPAMSNLEETLSTLDYAHRAKNITNKPEVNQKLTKRALIKEYTDEIERLRRDVDALREKNGIYLAAENYTEMLTKMEQQDEEIVNKISAIKALEEKVEKFEESFTSLNMKYSKVKEVMHQTLIERDEKNFLVEKYIEREQKHMEQKRQLKETVDETVNDVGILHTKLESIRKMEEYNSNVSQMFRRNHHDKTDEFHDSIKEFQHEAINSLEQEKHLILTSSQTLSTNLDYIRRCKSQSDSCAEELQKKFVDMKKNNTDQTESVKNQREITEKFVEESESNLSDNTTVVKEFSKTVPDLLSEMKQTHKQHNDHLLDVITKLQNFDYNSSLENRNRLENIQTTLEVDIEEVRQQNIENEKSFLTMLEKTISEMENKIEQRYRESLEENKLAKEHSEVRMKHIQDLLSAETSTKEKIEQNELNIKKQYVHDKREIELMKNQFNEKNRLEKQSIGEKVKNIQDSTRVIGETIEKDKNISEQKTASFGSLKSDVPKCCEIIDNGTQQNVNLCLKMEHTLLEKINEQNKSLDNFKTVVQSFHVDEISKLEEFNEALHSAQNIERELHSETSKIGETADKCFETQAHFEHTISELLDSQKDKLTSHGDSCADYISQLVDLSDKFIHHELRRNRPTGQTPERRNWQYPQVGCLTPQEQLIQRFRREKPIIPYDEFDSDYESNGNGDREVEEDKTSEEDSCDGHSSPDSGSSLRECTSTNDITSQMSITDSSILSDTQSTTSIPKPKKTIKPRGKNFFKKPARIN